MYSYIDAESRFSICAFALSIYTRICVFDNTLSAAVYIYARRWRL